jgi:hypothetical protein
MIAIEAIVREKREGRELIECRGRTIEQPTPDIYPPPSAEYCRINAWQQ